MEETNIQSPKKHSLWVIIIKTFVVIIKILCILGIIFSIYIPFKENTSIIDNPAQYIINMIFYFIGYSTLPCVPILLGLTKERRTTFIGYIITLFLLFIISNGVISFEILFALCVATLIGIVLIESVIKNEKNKISKENENENKKTNEGTGELDIK